MKIDGGLITDRIKQRPLPGPPAVAPEHEMSIHHVVADYRNDNCDRSGDYQDAGRRCVVLPPPAHLKRFFPSIDPLIGGLVGRTRNAIRRILHGRDDRLLVVIGPCSIHDPAAALEYAQRLRVQRERYANTLEIVMRVYLEKPRTTVGWKGLVNDPYLDGSCRIDAGLGMARQLLAQINRLGVPAASEFLDPLVPAYLADLVSWGAIGARTSESQTHRELAAGLDLPVGFKNNTDGNVKIAIQAAQAARHAHRHLSIQDDGRLAIASSTGNCDGHIILRGGRQPNYSAEDVTAACDALQQAGLPPHLVVDCSHANSAKRYQNQPLVAEAVAQQLRMGSRNICGVMVESHLQAGAQAYQPGRDDPNALRYGQSITDRCLGWDDSAQLLQGLADAVRQRRAHGTRVAVLSA